MNTINEAIIRITKAVENRDVDELDLISREVNEWLSHDRVCIMALIDTSMDLISEVKETEQGVWE